MAAIPWPAGFGAQRLSLTFSPVELPATAASMNVALIALLDAPTASVAGVFTTNALAGAPVLVGRRLLHHHDDDEVPKVRGVVVNNKVSNVGTGAAGEADATRVADAAARWAVERGLLKPAAEGAFLPSSTGVIGWRLPADAIVDALAADEAGKEEEAASTCGPLEVASAMMTTDRYPKVAAAPVGRSGASVVGVAKGAGMIEPDLSTMLAFVTTDAAVSRADLDRELRAAVASTFGCCGVDGDTSTSDTVVALASNKVRGVELADLRDALGRVCAQLAHHVVRNGEGTNHVMRVRVRGAMEQDRGLARRLARFVVNGPLLKTCVAGNDPNVGRLVARVGQFLGTARESSSPSSPSTTTTLGLDRCRVALGGKTVFRDGAFLIGAAAEEADLERTLVDHLRDAQLGPDDVGLPGCSPGDAFPRHGRCVEILLDFGGSEDTVALDHHEDDVVVLGSDLTHQYVTENADYRS